MRLPIFLSALFLAASMARPAEVEKGVAANNIQPYKFQSAALAEERSVSVLLPADYGSSFRRYPTLYLLHGYGDDNTAWSYMTNLSWYATHHKIIIVMPDGSKSFYVNSASNPKTKFEDYIAKDLVAWADSNFRTIPLPRARAIAGLSMGGYGAMYLGLKHHDVFTAIGAFSGALGIPHDNTPPKADLSEQDRKFDEDMNGIFGARNSEARKERDPFLLVEKVPAAEMPLIYIACGGQDFLLKQNRDFVDLLSRKKIPYEYREISPRVHAWDFWDDHIRVFLDLIDKKEGFGQ